MAALPGQGQMVKTDDTDNSPTTVAPNGDIKNGSELDGGFVDLILEEFMHLGIENRRIMCRRKGGGDYTICSPAAENTLKVAASLLGLGEEPWSAMALRDVTYRDLFEESTEDEEYGVSFADFGERKIENVAELPIRREVVDNLLNRNNHNMSILQFIQNILHPSAIDIPGMNPRVLITPSGPGMFNVQMAPVDNESLMQEIRNDIEMAELMGAYPEKVFLVDYKSADSLIENINMTAKFDPGIAGTFTQAAVDLADDKSSIMKFLSHGDIALELKDFLEDDTMNHPGDYKNIISFVGEASNAHATAEINSEKFFGTTSEDGKTKQGIPASVFTKFLMQDPDRLMKLSMLTKMKEGNTGSTDLLSNYMRGCTITIHGTTNIKPFSNIFLRGVLPNLEGIYFVHNVRESVTPQNYQTIIECVLIKTYPVLKDNKNRNTALIGQGDVVSVNTEDGGDQNLTVVEASDTINYASEMHENY